MKKFWLVFWNEYRGHVFRKRFLLILLSLPGFLLAAGLIGVLAIAGDYDPRPIGYVDPAGILTHPQQAPRGEDEIFPRVEIRRYESEAVARQDVENKTIQGVYILAEDYLASGEARLIALKPLVSVAQTQFSQFLRASLLSGQPQPVQVRILARARYEEPDAPSSGQTALNLLMPALTGLVFLMVINSSSGYLVQAVVEEKENRTVEIIMSSVSADSLMAGKVMGSLCAGLTQMLVWLAAPLLLALILRSSIPALQTLEVRPQFVYVSLLLMPAGFVMIAGLMAAVGASVIDAREAQQVAALFTIPIFAPLWFSMSIITHPNSPLARGLSYFPLTSPVALPLRAWYTVLPAWEIVLCAGLMYACATGAIWLAARAFRRGLLNYTRAVHWKDLLKRRAHG